MTSLAAVPRTLQSSYMRFAKRETAAPYNLAMSGIADCALSDLEFGPEDLALHGSNAYGYAPLIERIAGRFEAPTDCVVAPGGGCSFANHLALSALISPGDEVLVEDPTYELLVSTLACLGAQVRTFERRRSQDWRLDPDEIGASLSRRTRLVVLTNLHNPSGAMASEDEVRAAAAAASSVGARVLVDEVYLELTFADGKPRTAFRPDENIVVTSSLTKAYGLSGLRCGWVLAPPELAERMRRLNDLFGVHAPHMAEQLAVQAFDRLGAFRARADALLSANLAAYREILGEHPALEQAIFDRGTTVFPRLRVGDGDTLFQRLMANSETSLVPGRFFGLCDHVRIGLGGDPAATREGLTRVAEALAATH